MSWFIRITFLKHLLPLTFYQELLSLVTITPSCSCSRCCIIWHWGFALAWYAWLHLNCFLFWHYRLYLFRSCNQIQEKVYTIKQTMSLIILIYLKRASLALFILFSFCQTIGVYIAIMKFLFVPLLILLLSMVQYD